MFDSHAHYNDERFLPEKNSLLSTLFSSEISGIINAGTDKADSFESMKLAEKYKNMYFTAGVHPGNAVDGENIDEWLIPFIHTQKCVAIGEIGLDYHYDDPPRDTQMRVFRRQLEIASEYDVPVVIHDRDAHKDCLETILSFPAVTGVFHSFSGSAEMATILVKAGWYISFSGVITFSNAERTVKAAAAVPLDRLLSETDCPYLTPHPHRGKRNDSSYMRYTVEKLASIKNMSFEAMEAATTENAKRLFRLK